MMSYSTSTHLERSRNIQALLECPFSEKAHVTEAVFISRYSVHRGVTLTTTASAVTAVSHDAWL